MIRNSATNNTCITCHFNIYRYDDQTVYIYNYIHIYVWDSVQQYHPYGTFSKFPEQAKEK